MGNISRRLEEDTSVAAFYNLTRNSESLCPLLDETEERTKKYAGKSASESDHT